MTLADFLDDPALLRDVPRESIPPLIIALAARLLTEPARPPAEPHPPETDQLQYLTVPEVAGLTKFKESYVRELARRGLLPAVKIGRYTRIPLARFKEWVARQNGSPDQAVGKARKKRL